MSAVGTVQSFKTKPIPVEAIQFTGKNGKDVVEFAKKNDFGARNGGTYVHIFVGEDRLTACKGDFLAIEQNNGHLTLFDAESFQKYHTISKAHAIL